MGVIRVGDIIKEDHRVVLGSVETVVGERANHAADIFLIGSPGDTSLLQESDKMEPRLLVIDARKVIVEDPKIGSRFQPYIVWFTWVNTGRVIVLLSRGCHGKKRLIDVRC